mmetsp:Transcript_31546/g.100905  ORF Transcript_31546/g.100905 Transcript_31546/m.100905 type:complete len:111 (-) Transcript_31546:140-472(-)
MARIEPKWTAAMLNPCPSSSLDRMSNFLACSLVEPPRMLMRSDGTLPPLNSFEQSPILPGPLTCRSTRQQHRLKILAAMSEKRRVFMGEWRWQRLSALHHLNRTEYCIFL